MNAQTVTIFSDILTHHGLICHEVVNKLTYVGFLKICVTFSVLNRHLITIRLDEFCLFTATCVGRLLRPSSGNTNSLMQGGKYVMV